MLQLGQLFSQQPLSVADKLETLLLAANTLLALSGCLLLATVLVCYPLAEFFSFELQLAGHIALILSATLLKIAYVGRCIAQYELHKAVR